MPAMSRIANNANSRWLRAQRRKTPCIAVSSWDHDPGSRSTIMPGMGKVQWLQDPIYTRSKLLWAQSGEDPTWLGK